MSDIASDAIEHRIKDVSTWVALARVYGLVVAIPAPFCSNSGLEYIRGVLLNVASAKLQNVLVFDDRFECRDVYSGKLISHVGISQRNKTYIMDAVLSESGLLC